MSHGPCGSIHGLVSCLWIYYPHSDDPPKEPWVGIVQLLSPEPLQLFMVEERLYSQIIVYPQGLELLGQRKVCKDHVMDLNRVGLAFKQTKG